MERRCSEFPLMVFSHPLNALTIQLLGEKHLILELLGAVFHLVNQNGNKIRDQATLQYIQKVSFERLPRKASIIFFLLWKYFFLNKIFMILESSAVCIDS